MAAPPTLPPPLFAERQRMVRHWWGIVAALAFFLVGTGRATGHTWLSVLGMAGLVSLLAGFSLWLSVLHTQLTAQGIWLRFVPFRSQWQLIPWSQVRRAYVRTYSPLGEYGGWGIRTFMGENSAYNVWGTNGLQLVLASGESLLVGTQQPAAMRQAMQQLRPAGVAQAPRSLGGE